MSTSNNNLINSLPKELFDSTYNNEESEQDVQETPGVYEEEIPAYAAQALLPSGEYDPAAKYKLVSEMDNTTLIKITYRNDEASTVDKVEEFDLNSDDEVQTLFDVLHDMHIPARNIMQDDKRIKYEMDKKSHAMTILVMICVILFIIGICIVGYCLNFGR